jgi:hypothetical protein
MPVTEHAVPSTAPPRTGSTMRRSRTLPLSCVALLALASCSGSDDPGQEPATDVAGTTAAPSTAPEGHLVSPADSVQEARLRLPGGPDWLVADDSGVWVKRDNGSVDRIDPGTDEVSVTVDVGGDLCQGIGAGSGAVWACSGTDVVRIDPEAGTVTATYPVGKAFAQGHLVTGSGRLWVLTGDGSTLAGIDPATGATVTSVPLGARGTDVAVGEAGLWVVSGPDGQLLRIDPAGTVALRVTGIAQPIALAVTDQVWLGNATATLRIDPGTGTTQATSAIGLGPDGGLAVGRDGVWVRSADRFLVELDPGDATPVRGVSADVTSSGDITVAFGSVWTTAFDDAALFRVPDGGS